MTLSATPLLLTHMGLRSLISILSMCSLTRLPSNILHYQMCQVHGIYINTVIPISDSHQHDFEDTYLNYFQAMYFIVKSDSVALTAVSTPS